MRSPFADWQPFDVSSDVLLTSLKPWRKAYNLPRDDADDSQALIVSDVHGDGVHDGESQRSMTAWEGLLWSLWLPKVRAAIKYVTAL
jgi:tuftelin-interacting protein 11